MNGDCMSTPPPTLHPADPAGTEHPVQPLPDTHPDVPAGAAEPVDITPAELARRVLRLFHNKHFGLLLILAMGFLTLMGTLLQQAAEEVRGDPAAYADWLDSVRPRYGGWTGILDAAGMFAVFSSVWFKAVTILLALSIIACTLHRVPLLWQAARHPHTHVTSRFLDHGGAHAAVSLPVPPKEALARVDAALAGHRYRRVSEPRGPGLNLYADRFRFAPFGTAVAHTSFVIILLGVLVTTTAGFKDQQFAVTVGSRAEVGHGTGLAVEAREFTDVYHPSGAPKDYASDLVLYHDGVQVAQQVVRVNQPMRYDGVSFYQAFFGIATVVKVTDGRGATVFEGGVPLRWSSGDGSRSFGRFDIPGRGITAYVITAASGKIDPEIGAGQVQLEVHTQGEQAGDRPATALVSQGRSASLAGHTFTFERERQFTGLIVGRDPGAVWVWVGSGLMVLGLLLTLFFRHRRVWVRVEEAPGGSRVRLASTERADSAFETWLHGLAAQVGQPTNRTKQEVRHDG